MSNGKLSLTKLNDLMQDGFNNIPNDINELKNHIIKNLIDTNKKLQKKIESLENELLITKKATQKNKIDIEANNQYGRRNNIVISDNSKRGE